MRAPQGVRPNRVWTRAVRGYQIDTVRVDPYLLFLPHKIETVVVSFQHMIFVNERTMGCHRGIWLLNRITAQIIEGGIPKCVVPGKYDRIDLYLQFETFVIWVSSVLRRKTDVLQP